MRKSTEQKQPGHCVASSQPHQIIHPATCLQLLCEPEAQTHQKRSPLVMGPSGLAGHRAHGTPSRGAHDDLGPAPARPGTCLGSEKEIRKRRTYHALRNGDSAGVGPCQPRCPGSAAVLWSEIDHRVDMPCLLSDCGRGLSGVQRLAFG